MIAGREHCKEAKTLLGLVRDDVTDEDLLREITDPTVAADPDKELLAIVLLAKLCTHINPEERPKMKCRDAEDFSVVNVLT